MVNESTFTQRKTFSFKLKPSKSQEQAFCQFAGNSRFVYNSLLAWAKQSWSDTGENVVSRTHMSRQITHLRNEFGWLAESPRKTLSTSGDDLIRAYGKFFSKKSSYPKFKCKKRSRPSFRYKAEKRVVRVEGSKIRLPKIGMVPFVKSQEVLGDIKEATVLKMPSGWYVRLSCTSEVRTLPSVSSRIGLDLGIKNFAHTSSDVAIPNPKFYRSKERKLRKLSKSLSRKVKGGSNRRKAKIKLAKHHEKISNIRKDFLHKLSTKVIRENQTIAIEDLNIKGMIKNRRLSKSISDASWGEFVHQLEYKASWYGRNVIKIDRWYPSSKTTNCCGDYIEGLKLHHRNVTCSVCGEAWGRDHNAALNILNVAVGHTETKNDCGGECKTGFDSAVASEAVIPNRECQNDYQSI